MLMKLCKWLALILCAAYTLGCGVCGVAVAMSSWGNIEFEHFEWSQLTGMLWMLTISGGFLAAGVLGCKRLIKSLRKPKP
jgi:hypothetical protein